MNGLNGWRCVWCMLFVCRYRIIGKKHISIATHLNTASDMIYKEIWWTEIENGIRQSIVFDIILRWLWGNERECGGEITMSLRHHFVRHYKTSTHIKHTYLFIDVWLSNLTSSDSIKHSSFSFSSFYFFFLIFLPDFNGLLFPTSFERETESRERKNEPAVHTKCVYFKINS